MFIIGIDLGGTQIRTGLFDELGKLLKKVKMPTLPYEGPEAVITRIIESIYHVCETPIHSDNYLGIGIGSPGPLNPFKGIVLSPPNLHGWSNIPLRDILANEFQIPVHLNNDANVGVLGEHYYGKGQGIDNLIYITISTGVGAGIMIGGKLLLGQNGSAGEIGHMMLDPDGPTCGCGNSGCLEAFVSGTGIVNRTYQRLQSNTNSALRRSEQLTSKEIFDAAMEGDSLAMDIVEETRLYLGIGVANLINLYNPGMIVFGGGVSQVGDFLIAPALEIAKKRALKGTIANLQFTTSGLGEDVGLIGAAALIKYDDMSSSVQ